MRILVVLPFSPYPVRRGTGRLVMNLLEGLSLRHEVTLVTMTFSKDDSERLREIEKKNISVRPVLAPNKKNIMSRIFFKLRNIAAMIFMRIPIEVSYTAPVSFLKEVRRAAEEIDADLVLSSYWHLYRLPSFLKGRKTVLITHDLDYLMKNKRIENAQVGLKRAFVRLDADLKEKIEIKAYRIYDTILTVTSRDAEDLLASGHVDQTNVLPLPLALDLERFRTPQKERMKDRIVMIGQFNSDFNRDALRYFLEDVFPLVLAKRPGVLFQVIGGDVDDELKKLGGERTEFCGYVEDITHLLQSCSLLVLPLRFAGGVRIRMMEAAAMAVPVVSTPAGVEGMDLVPGKDYMEASNANEMADKIELLLGDSVLAERVGNNARKWAERNISMKSYPERLDLMISAIFDR